MKLLFDQDYAQKVAMKEYGKEQAKLGEEKGAIKGTIETCQDFGASVSAVIHRLVAKFGLTHDEAENYVHEFWKS